MLNIMEDLNKVGILSVSNGVICMETPLRQYLGDPDDDRMSYKKKHRKNQSAEFPHCWVGEKSLHRMAVFHPLIGRLCFLKAGATSVECSDWLRHSCSEVAAFFSASLLPAMDAANLQQLFGNQ